MPVRSIFCLRPLALAALLACQAPSLLQAQTLPGTATVINGVVDVQRFTNGVQVTNTPGAILHWDRFSIGTGNTVRFVQQGPSSAVLNRVTGNTPSQIHGALQSNGRVFLLNPNGILFGAGARVDVAGLLASTLDIRDQDFLDGRYDFKCFNAIACEGGVDALNPYNNRVVLEDGSQITTRTAGEGGQVWLIARDRVVTEKGSRIEAPSGQVMAATAREVSITSPALGQMRFTLTGTAGSRIDLAGEIDAPRGAAGFFADTVRFAGPVRVRSDVGAAGQIVASAAANLAVDADARLDVSGTPGADAGAVRLNATQQIKVSAASEIAADGGNVSTQGVGGQGGLIELIASAVELPGLLANRDTSPLQLHARGYGAQGLDLARYGRVEVQETGNFAYTVVDGPGWTDAAASTVMGRSTVSTGLGITNGSTDETYVETVVPAGDGSFLVLTRRIDATEYREIQNSPTNNVWDVRINQAIIHTALLVGADGQVIRSQTLGRSDYASLDTLDSSTVSVDTPQSTYAAVGLSKGGWAVLQSGAHSRILFLDAASGIAATADVPEGALLRPLLGGGVLVQATVNGVEQRLVFDNRGRAVPEVAAALAGESLDRSLGWVYLDRSRTPVDERRALRLPSGGPLQLVDLATETVDRVVQTDQEVRGVIGVMGTSILGIRPSTTSGSGGVRSETTPIGVWDKGVFTQIALGRYEIRDLSAGSTEDSFQSTVGPYVLGAVNSGAMVLMHVDESYNLQGTTVRNTVTNTTELDRTASRDAQNTVQLLRRTLQNEPFAATGTEGAVLLPLLLASQPGRTNGALGAVGTPTFPAEGGGPTTPTMPTTPPVTPPTNPTTPGAPVAEVPADTSPPPTLEQQIPPPPYQPATRPAEGLKPLPGLSVADVAKFRTGDLMGPKRYTQLTPEQMENARAVIVDVLGPDTMAEFEKGTDERRRQIMEDVAWHQNLQDPELFEATRSMGREMRGATLNALALLQSYGTLDTDALAEGLRKALATKVPAPTPDDGSAPDRARTPVETELQILEAELHQATLARMRAEGQGEAERKVADKAYQQATGRLARTLVIASREASGETVDDSGDVEIASNEDAAIVLTPDGDVRQVNKSPEAKGT